MVAIVGADEAKVEADLRAGLLACPDCQGVLAPWGHGVQREVRQLVGSTWLRPRRSICRPERHSHVLLPETTLIRRRHAGEVIGTALLRRSQGQSIAGIAGGLGCLVETVRGWIRAFSRNIEAIRQLFTRWYRVLEPLGEPIEPAGNAFSDAVAAIGAASRAAVLHFGRAPQWSFLSRLSGGALLRNTSFLYRAMPIA